MAVLLNDQKMTFEREQRIHEKMLKSKKKEIQRIKEDLLYFELENRKLEKSISDFESLSANVRNKLEAEFGKGLKVFKRKSKRKLEKQRQKDKYKARLTIERMNDEMEDAVDLVLKNTRQLEEAMRSTASKCKEMEYESSVHINGIFESNDCAQEIRERLEQAPQEQARDPFESEQKPDFSGDKSPQHSPGEEPLGLFESGAKDAVPSTENGPRGGIDLKNKEEEVQDEEAETPIMMKNDSGLQETVDATNMLEQKSSGKPQMLQENAEVIPKQPGCSGDAEGRNGPGGSSEEKDAELMLNLENEMKQKAFEPEIRNEPPAVGSESPAMNSDPKNDENSQLDLEKSEPELEREEKSSVQMDDKSSKKSESEANQDDLTAEVTEKDAEKLDDSQNSGKSPEMKKAD